LAHSALLRARVRRLTSLLRLSVKYLVFDLEATRRENAYLRRIIEQSNRSRPKPEEPTDRRHDEPAEEERPDFGANGWE
jgi:hypothetical protein